MLFYEYCPTCMRKTEQEVRNVEMDILGIEKIVEADVCLSCHSERTSHQFKKYNKRRTKEEINRHVSSLFQSLK